MQNQCFAAPRGVRNSHHHVVLWPPPLWARVAAYVPRTCTEDPVRPLSAFHPSSVHWAPALSVACPAFSSGPGIAFLVSGEFPAACSCESSSSLVWGCPHFVRICVLEGYLLSSLEVGFWFDTFQLKSVIPHPQ